MHGRHRLGDHRDRPGHYEVRSETRVGVRLCVLYWCEPGQPAMLFTTISPDRLPLLAEALNAYLAGGPAGPG
jgi:hypothetical protein